MKFMAGDIERNPGPKEVRTIAKGIKNKDDMNKTKNQEGIKTEGKNITIKKRTKAEVTKKTRGQ